MLTQLFRSQFSAIWFPGWNYYLDRITNYFNQVIQDHFIPLDEGSTVQAAGQEFVTQMNQVISPGTDVSGVSHLLVKCFIKLIISHFTESPGETVGVLKGSIKKDCFHFTLF